MTRQLTIVSCITVFLLGGARAQPAERPWLQRAQDVAAWLEDQSADDGSIPADTLTPDSVRHDLASGTAGYILLHAALYAQTGDYEQLSALRRRADLLAENLPKALDLQEFPSPAGFYYGLAGMSFALNEAYRITGDETHRQAAEAGVRLLIESARPDETGLRHWNDRFDELLFGNTGTALFLLYSATRMGMEEALPLSVEQGKRLLQLAQTRGEGWTWSMRGDEPEVELPNFSHGAAGIGYFLATLSMLDDDPRFLQGAERAAKHLENLAVRDYGGVLFPYGFPRPEWEGRYDIGWAHGVAGTARLFQRLHQLSGLPAWEDLTAECTAAVIRSNAPREPAPGFGEGPFPMNRRFGLAGAAEFLIARHRQTGEPEYLRDAEEIGEFIYLQAKRDEPGLYWESPRPAFVERPGDPARYTGWFTGAVGYALLFLELDAAGSGTLLPIALPDDPLRFIPSL